jgi:hypothetical protein
MQLLCLCLRKRAHPHLPQETRKTGPEKAQKILVVPIAIILRASSSTGSPKKPPDNRRQRRPFTGYWARSTSALLPSAQGSRAVSVLVAWSCRLVAFPTLPHPDPGERAVVGCTKPADLCPSSQLRKLNAETNTNSQTLGGIYM